MARLRRERLAQPPARARASLSEISKVFGLGIPRAEQCGMFPSLCVLAKAPSWRSTQFNGKAIGSNGLSANSESFVGKIWTASSRGFRENRPRKPMLAALLLLLTFPALGNYGNRFPKTPNMPLIKYI
jgi:hypothetical protein